MSVHSTTVFGIMVGAGRSSCRVSIRSMKASPRPLPPKDPSPIRAKLLYWSKRSRWNTATTPWFFIFRYATMASNVIWRWASTSWSESQVMCLRNCEIGNRAREPSQREMLLWVMWLSKDSRGSVNMLFCSSLRLWMRAISSPVTGSVNTKSPKPKYCRTMSRKSTSIFFEFLSMKW